MVYNIQKQIIIRFDMKNLIRPHTTRTFNLKEVLIQFTKPNLSVKH